MSDDIYEQSAQHAIRVAKSAALEKTERNAADTGLQARSIEDGVMNGGRSYSGGGQRGPGDVMARESAENRRVVQMRRVIEDAGELDMNDLLAPSLSDGRDPVAQSEARKMMKMQQVAGHMINSGAKQVVNNAYMDPTNEASMLMEQEAYQPVSDSGWGVVKRSATLKSGKQVPVFMVEDSISGMTTGKRYRLGVVAEKIARVLNATQNPNDGRIKMIESAYDRHVQLMRDRAGAKKSGNTKRLAIIESELQEVNARLGLD